MSQRGGRSIFFEKRFRERLEPFTPELFQRLPVPKNPLRIPYIREYAYAEQVAMVTQLASKLSSKPT
jgi:hypothetical protein